MNITVTAEYRAEKSLEMAEKPDRVSFGHVEFNIQSDETINIHDAEWSAINQAHKRVAKELEWSDAEIRIKNLRFEVDVEA